MNEPDLDVFFRVLYEGKAYMIYANTGSFKCYECGGVGHKRLTCPHKAGTSGETARPSTAAENGTEDTLPPVVEKRDAQIVKLKTLLIMVMMRKLLLKQNSMKGCTE